MMGTNDLVDLIGSNESKSQFSVVLLSGKIPCREPDLLAWWGWDMVVVGVYLRLLGGMQKGRTDMSPHTSAMTQVDPGRRHHYLVFLYLKQQWLVPQGSHEGQKSSVRREQ